MPTRMPTSTPTPIPTDYGGGNISSGEIIESSILTDPYFTDQSACTQYNRGDLS